MEPVNNFIKVIGVGGGGGNAVNLMYRQGIPQHVSFVNIDSDANALHHSDVPDLVPIGDGLGAGNKPEKARAFAEDAAEEIGKLFDDDTRMVILIAGMGGGTGTGAAPVVARMARERGLLTVGIFTLPYIFEGHAKIKRAVVVGVNEMEKYVDALLVLNNERLIDIYDDLEFLNAFGKSDETISAIVRSLTEIFTNRGRINIDFNDIDNTLRNSGWFVIATGIGEGEDRVGSAIQDAVNSPLLKNREIREAKKFLINLFYNTNAEDKLLMSETNELSRFIASLDEEADVIWGVGHDESLGNKVKITILASGF